MAPDRHLCREVRPGRHRGSRCCSAARRQSKGDRTRPQKTRISILSNRWRPRTGPMKAMPGFLGWVILVAAPSRRMRHRQSGSRTPKAQVQLSARAAQPGKVPAKASADRSRRKRCRRRCPLIEHVSRLVSRRASIFSAHSRSARGPRRRPLRTPLRGPAARFPCRHVTGLEAAPERPPGREKSVAGAGGSWSPQVTLLLIESAGRARSRSGRLPSHCRSAGVPWVPSMFLELSQGAGVIPTRPLLQAHVIPTDTEPIVFGTPAQ